VFLFNRSPGDPLRESTAERQALIERLPKAAGRRFIAISPMPNIDGGLELVTSDGALASRMQRTIHSLPSEFTVRVKGQLGPDQINGIRSGKLDRDTPVTVDNLESSEADTEAANRWYLLVARGASGKDVRQLFERQGALVSRVLRVAIAAVRLDKTLARGQFRQLLPAETSTLLSGEAAATAPDESAD
jgi:23S rRNA pseudouridine2605 synthase